MYKIWLFLLRCFHVYTLFLVPFLFSLTYPNSSNFLLFSIFLHFLSRMYKFTRICCSIYFSSYMFMFRLPMFQSMSSHFTHYNITVIIVIQLAFTIGISSTLLFSISIKSVFVYFIAIFILYFSKHFIILFCCHLMYCMVLICLPLHFLNSVT